MDERWTLYEHPDPMDRPAALPDHPAWLAAGSFSGGNVFWERAGHAVYGGDTT